MPKNSFPSLRCPFSDKLLVVLFFILLASTVYADYLNGTNLFTPNNPPVFSSQLDEKQNDNKQKEKINNFSRLKQSAESGFSPAQHALAIYYLTTDKSNISVAVFWLKKAVEQDNVDAMRDLAYLYYQGLGVKKDLPQARFLLTEPVRQKNVFAIHLLSDIKKEQEQKGDKHFFKNKSWYNAVNRNKIKQNSFIIANVDAWRRAWQGQDIKHYLSFYSKKFKSSKGNYDHWVNYKRKIFKHSTNIQISIKDLKTYKKTSIIVVSFYQHYRSNTYSDMVYKELHWQKEADSKWRIILESATTCNNKTRINCEHK